MNEPEDPFDRLERAAHTIVVRQGWEQANRLGLLATHGTVGVCAGALMLVNGTALTFEPYGIWPRIFLGFLSLIGGSILLAGLLSHPRNLKKEIAGLLMIGLWDIAMTVGFVLAIQDSGEVIFRWPWENIPYDVFSRLYPLVIYTGMGTLILIHLYTLKKLRRGQNEH